MINTNYNLAYQHVSLLIEQFEAAALAKPTIASVKAVATHSLEKMDQMLSASQEVLTKYQHVTKPDINGNFDLNSLSGSLDGDTDLLELFGGPDNPVKDYLSTCLSCSLRLKFQWQLKPIDLLASIGKLVADIKASLSRFNFRLDPMGVMEDICIALNELCIVCPADLIMLLMSIKLLLKKYLMNSFKFKLDWTTILGPLLQGLTQGLSALLSNLGQIILSPLDCLLADMRAGNDLLKDTLDELNSLQSLANQTDDLLDSLQSGQTSPLSLLEVQKSPVGQFNLTADMSLDDALRDPSFGNATFLDKLIIPVQEAQAWLAGLIKQVLDSLNALGELASGGVCLQLDNLGVVLFLLDLISLVMMIIQLIAQNKDVKDWCTFLENNPSLLENNLRRRYGSDVSVTSDKSDVNNKQLLIKLGPNLVGSIKTCQSDRRDVDSKLLSQWIADLSKAK